MSDELNIQRFKTSVYGHYFVPENERSEEILIAIAMKNGENIKALRVTDKTQLVCNAAVEKDPLMIEFVPVAMQTPEMVKRAVKKDHDSYKLIDDSKKTFESSMLAVAGNGYLIQDVPLNQRTNKMYEKSVNQNPFAIEHCPIEIQSPLFVLKLIRRFPQSYMHVHDSKKTVEAAFFAVKDDGLILQYVPDHHRTKKVCKAAVFSNARAIKYVPIRLQTPKQCIASLIPGPN